MGACACKVLNQDDPAPHNLDGEHDSHHRSYVTGAEEKEETVAKDVKADVVCTALAAADDFRLSEASTDASLSEISGKLPSPSNAEHFADVAEGTRKQEERIEICENDDDFECGSDDGMPPDFGDPLFWKEVYTHKRSRKNVPQEWIVAYKDFKAQRWHRFLRGGSILDLGCGDSNFMSDAYDDGNCDITCTDIEPSVVETMRQRNAISRPEIKYLVCDARDMHPFADQSFDIIFEKGAMDALKCAGRAAASRCSSEIHRVLKDTGLYICVSLQEPEAVMHAIRQTGCVSRQWHVQPLTYNEEAHDGWPQDVHVFVSRKIQIRR